MCGRLKWLASARAIVPFPLAAGPSTAITRPRLCVSLDGGASFKKRALTAPNAYGKAPAERCRRLFRQRENSLSGEMDLMVKPEWGTKRTCPKCSTRFYD